MESMNNLDELFPHLRGAFDDEKTSRRRRPSSQDALRRGPAPSYDDEVHRLAREARRRSYRRVRYGEGELSKAERSEIRRRSALVGWRTRRA